jgi:hypothetical protein
LSRAKRRSCTLYLFLTSNPTLDTARALAHNLTGDDGVISIELEDVPGVSRGRAALHGDYGEVAFVGEAFDQENLASVY